MGIFAIIIILPIVFICALLGMVCLKIAKLPTNIPSVSIFTCTGGITGVVTIIMWGFIFSNSKGQLTLALSVISMFIVAGIFAVIAGIYASSLYAKHNKNQNSRLRLGRGSFP